MSLIIDALRKMWNTIDIIVLCIRTVYNTADNLFWTSLCVLFGGLKSTYTNRLDVVLLYRYYRPHISWCTSISHVGKINFYPLYINEDMYIPYLYNIIIFLDNQTSLDIINDTSSNFETCMNLSSFINLQK